MKTLPRQIVRTTLALLLAAPIHGCESSIPVNLLRDGDIIFQTSKSSQSEAIQRATHSPYSHMGMILHLAGEICVFEAHGPVGYEPLKKWIRRGKGHRYVVKRLHDADVLLTPAAVEKIRAVASTFKGRPYDLAFDWSDDRMYCSELVWKTYKLALGLEIGRCQKLGEFDLDDPAVQAALHKKYGNNVPLGATVISPAAILGSPALDTVVQR